MVLSSAERDDLVQRVARKLTRVAVRDDVVREAVDRTLGALAKAPGLEPAAPPAPVDAGEGMAVLVGASMPDLASRVRRALEGEGIAIAEMGVATEGRYTVVMLRLPLAAAEQARAAAATIGARFSWRGVGR